MTMPKFNWKAKPTHDARWLGIQRHYFTLWLLKTLLTIPFIATVIAEASIEANRRDGGANAFWGRIGCALVPDAALTLLIALAIMTQRWHPIAALVSSILYIGLWLLAFVVNWVVVGSGETVFWTSARDGLREMWERLCFAEMAFQLLLAVVYAVQVGFAAKAVHGWRREGERQRAYAGIELSAGNVAQRVLAGNGGAA